MAKLREQIAADIDWSSGGIDNCRLPVAWLRRHGEDAVATVITTTVARRHQIHPDEKIQSWSYFESEIEKLGTGGAGADDSGDLVIIA